MYTKFVSYCINDVMNDSATILRILLNKNFNLIKTMKD